LTKPDDGFLREQRALLEQLGPKATPQLAAGLDTAVESDPTVRLTSVETYRDLTGMLLDPNRLPNAPGNVSKNDPYYDNLLNTYRSITNLQPLFEAMRSNSDSLVDATADPDPAIRTAAMAALRDLVEIRNRVLAWQAEFQRYA